jgi:branched-chain amino acid transport system permease protein
LESASQIIANIILQASLILIVAVFYQLLYYTTKFSNLAHAAIITIAPYLAFTFSNLLGLALYFAIFLSVCCSVLVGLTIEKIVYSKMRKNNLPNYTYLIASIGIYTILQNLISIAFGDDTKTLFKGEVIVGHELFGAYITNIQIITIIFSVVIFTGVWLFNQYTKLGKSIRAVATNPELCNIYGINSNKVILWSFAIGSALGAIAGILSAYDTNMTPTFGFNLLLYGVVAMIIGGMGSMRGLIGGAFLVATAQHLAAYYLDTKWMDAIAYIILIIFLIWKPYGFSGNRLKKVEI